MSTTKTKDIWNAVVSILKTAKQSGNLSYIDEILEGTREDISRFPVIILEPTGDREVQHTVPQYKRITVDISISCWIETYAKDKQIIGEENNKGILDIVADVKNELDKFPDLNGKCIKFEFPTTMFVFETYPYRVAEITMSVEFITSMTAR